MSDQCKLVLLDLLCINNSDDLKEPLLTEENYHMRGLLKENESKINFVVNNTWK